MPGLSDGIAVGFLSVILDELDGIYGESLSSSDS
jgi:hypothetical protein